MKKKMTVTKRPAARGKVLALPARPALREPIALKPDAAVMSVLGQVVAQVSNQDAVRIALNSFCEGRGLEGTWALRIVAAELVPVE